MYRAIAARLNYLAPDRMDIQYAVKEAARAMSAPKKKHWRMLHKIGRYLLGAPRMIIRFPWRVSQTMLTTFTDSDWAGCIRTARSTSGGIVTIGDHVIKTYSRQLKVVALSSAEAELYAMVAASAESLAIISYSRDLGHALGGEILTDSAAALGIGQRAGIGKVRHLRTQGLWVQEVRVSGRLKYRKVLGTLNPSDVLTKHVAGDLLERHIETMGMVCPGGRAETAPELNSLEMVMVSWTGVLQEADGLSGARAQVGDRARRVRFSPVVQFRAVEHCNRGRRCQKASKERAVPGGARREADALSDRPRAKPEERDRVSRIPGGVSQSSATAAVDPASGARPRWADEEDLDSLTVSALLHGSGVPAIMVPELSGSRGLGNLLTLWQAIGGCMRTRHAKNGDVYLTPPWRHHTD